MLARFVTIGEIVLPIFLIIATGHFIVRLKVVQGSISNNLSRITFYLALPVLLFLAISQSEIQKDVSWRLILVSYGIITTFFLVSFVIARLLRFHPSEIGVFVQGSFRSNMSYIGLPVAISALGEENTSRIALFLAFVVPYLNALSVIALAVLGSGATGKGNLKKAFFPVLKNPLIIACVVGGVFSVLNIPMHSIIMKTLLPIKKIALPLALLSIGASLRFDRLRDRISTSLLTALFKLLIVPTSAFIISYWVGLDRIDTGIAIIMFASPTAIASYIMAKEMHGNAELAADIVMTATVISIITLSFWIWIII